MMLRSVSVTSALRFNAFETFFLNMLIVYTLSTWGFPWVKCVRIWTAAFLRVLVHIAKRQADALTSIVSKITYRLFGSFIDAEVLPVVPS